MCCDCWERDGAHRIDNERVRRIVEVLKDADHYGSLHVVVDDKNVDNESLAFCRKWGAERNEWTENDEALCSAMEAATYEERVSAMGIDDGCFTFGDKTSTPANTQRPPAEESR